MSGRVKIKSKDKDKKPKIDVFKVIENRFKNMNELRDLIDMDPMERAGSHPSWPAHRVFRQLLLLANTPPSMSRFEISPPMYLTSLFIICYVLIISQI